MDRAALDKLLDVATEAARTAGNYALANKARRTEVAAQFKHDVKLKLDLESQDKAEAVIRARFPGHSFLGEENLAIRAADLGGEPAPEWVIDPIDGTVNFSHGMPLWCCSVAVRQGERVLAGAVYAPELNELYTATVDRPALCNGKPLHVSGVRSLDQAMICTGLEKNADPIAPPFRILHQLYDGVQKCRVLGSAALDLCRVAAGQVDGYFESGIYLWDIAAAGLIVERAGGRAEALRTLPGYRYCYAATNGLIQEAFTNLLAPVLPPE